MVPASRHYLGMFGRANELLFDAVGEVAAVSMVRARHGAAVDVRRDRELSLYHDATSVLSGRTPIRRPRAIQIVRLHPTIADP
jgi:hypothetical protein